MLVYSTHKVPGDASVDIHVLPGQFTGGYTCTCEIWQCTCELQVHQIYAHCHGNKICSDVKCL